MPSSSLPLTEPRFDQTAPLQAGADAVLERARIMLGTRGYAVTAAGTHGALKPALINAILWMFIGPALAVWLRRRTERALAALLQTLAGA